jgi:hypothetical protein
MGPFLGVVVDFVLCKAMGAVTDVSTDRMIQIMQAMSDGEQGSQTARTRVQVLSEFLL